MLRILSLFIFLGLLSCNKKTIEPENTAPPTSQPAKEEIRKNGTRSILEYTEGKGYEKYSVATFAGGCFWCTEAAFECIKGVEDVISGYSGGHLKRATYEEVGGGNTGHAEAIQIFYNPRIIDFKTLLDIFFVAHDPTQVNGQAPDWGSEYRSVIFYHSPEQKDQIHHFIREQSNNFSKPIATEILAYKEFWVAEEYHQDYYWLHPENSYVQNVSVKKVKKVERKFPDLLKEDCGK